MGGPGSGSPVHFHNDAINYNVYGTKLWTLLPPPHAIYSRRHASVDLVQVQAEAAAANRTAMRCVQRAGDLLYVPDGWAHGVLNLGATVGWANSFFAPQHKFVMPPHHFHHGGKLFRTL